MRIGFDLDNTIVCYDGLFHRCATEQGLIPAPFPKSKEQIRDHLRAQYSNDRWTELQGLVYGPRMEGAPMFPGCMECMVACRQKGIPMAIVSHRTRYAARGPCHDLHQAAREWLVSHGILGGSASLFTEERVLIAESREEKIRKIRSLDLSDFLDDLREVLEDPDFPSTTKRIWFNPQQIPGSASGIRSICSWDEMKQIVLGEP